ncbi:unnamed protein product [Prunus armeniaca]|uniref:Uncharacterized protein n=1 Tax=Prunus armeniaca TaxID=36596 RepID=A0A6J5UD96_PRUAR|nr:unnamed protein product [Prunus armeniaca]
MAVLEGGQGRGCVVAGRWWVVVSARGDALSNLLCMCFKVGCSVLLRISSKICFTSYLRFICHETGMHKKSTSLEQNQNIFTSLSLSSSGRIPKGAISSQTSDVEAACLPGPKNAPPYCPLGVGDDGDKRVRMGVEPAEERIVELAQGAHLGLEGVSGQVLDVLEADGDGGVAGEREN